MGNYGSFARPQHAHSQFAIGHRSVSFVYKIPGGQSESKKEFFLKLTLASSGEDEL